MDCAVGVKGNKVIRVFDQSKEQIRPYIFQMASFGLGFPINSACIGVCLASKVVAMVVDCL